MGGIWEKINKSLILFKNKELVVKITFLFSQKILLFFKF